MDDDVDVVDVVELDFFDFEAEVGVLVDFLLLPESALLFERLLLELIAGSFVECYGQVVHTHRHA